MYITCVDPNGTNTCIDPKFVMAPNRGDKTFA